MKTIFKNLSFLIVISLCFQSCKFATEDKKELIVGVQTWSFRTMEDQSPLAILEYIKQAGIKHVELMGNHAESYAGAPESPISNPKIMPVLYKKYKQEELTEEEEAIVAQFEIDRKAYEVELAAWHKTVNYSKFEELRDLYAEAGISIFAFKPRVFEKESTEEAIRYGMRAAKALGASHVTLEHPEDDKHTARLAKIAEEENMLIGYHGHEQQTPTLWDTAMAQSSANLMNLDFGHYIAGENENVIEFIEEKHDKIISMHLKDRQRKSNGGGNLMWGKGDTPIKEVVQLIYNNNYKFPVTIEVEYEIPEGSSAIDEVKRCNEYIQNILKN